MGGPWKLWAAQLECLLWADEQKAPHNPPATSPSPAHSGRLSLQVESGCSLPPRPHLVAPWGGNPFLAPRNPYSCLLTHAGKGCLSSLDPEAQRGSVTQGHPQAGTELEWMSPRVWP